MAPNFRCHTLPLKLPDLSPETVWHRPKSTDCAAGGRAPPSHHRPITGTHRTRPIVDRTGSSTNAQKSAVPDDSAADFCAFAQYRMAAFLRCHTKFLNWTNHIRVRGWHCFYLALHTLRQTTHRKHAGLHLL